MKNQKIEKLICQCHFFQDYDTMFSITYIDIKHIVRDNAIVMKILKSKFSTEITQNMSCNIIYVYR